MWKSVWYHLESAGEICSIELFVWMFTSVISVHGEQRIETLETVLSVASVNFGHSWSLTESLKWLVSLEVTFV